MKIEINNKRVNVPAAFHSATLLDFIRDFVGLKGTKFGCGVGRCGACTVHVDGTAERSCRILVEGVGGQSITTIEGLAATASTGSLHPVQQAWIEENVPQCGYCQPGQIMTAAALLKQIPAPSSEEIKQEMSGNLCRCGTYERIRKAVANAAGKGGKNARD